MFGKLAGQPKWRTRDCCEDDKAKAKGEAPPYRGIISPSLLCACEDCGSSWKESEDALVIYREWSSSLRRLLEQVEGVIISPSLLCACEDCGISWGRSEGALLVYTAPGSPSRRFIELKEECPRRRSMRWRFRRRTTRRELNSSKMSTLLSVVNPALYTGPSDSGGCGFLRLVETVLSRDVSGLTIVSLHSDLNY